MKPVNVCIVVFNRYDLLANLFASIRASELTPAAVYVIDRGGQSNLVDAGIGDGIGADVHRVLLPGQSLPEAWNWFMTHVPEERIITSDDIEFLPGTLGEMAAYDGDFIGLNDGRSSHYACFMVRDSCIAKVGLFDEAVSPDYMYFEDCDYAYRMKLLGIPTGGVYMKHGLAQSWERKTEQQQNEHHGRFILAEANYVRKWGGRPCEEKFAVPYGGI